MRTLASASTPPALGTRSRRAALVEPLLLSAAAAAPAFARPVPDEAVAQRVFEEARGSVLAVADYRVRDGAVSDVQPLCSGVVWDQRGYVVTSYSAVTRGGARSGGDVGAAAASAASSANTPSAPAAPLAAGANAAGAEEGRRLLRVALLDTSVDPPLIKQYPAVLVGASPLHHLAVLLITDVPQEILSPVQLGRNADVQVGQAAYVLGLRLGSTHSLSVGVVSGLRRPLLAAPGAGPGLLLPGGAIQTDANVDAASTGGAVLDSGGRLMGLGMLPPGRRSAASLSFAVPVDVVARVVPQLIAGTL